MASRDLTLYVLRELYAHEVFMRNAYAQQLENIPPGKEKDAVQRIHDDEIRHCQEFAKILARLDRRWKPSNPPVERKWDCSQEKNLREALEFDARMEGQLEASYLEHLHKEELTREAREAIQKVMGETHAHAEILGLLLKRK